MREKKWIPKLGRKLSTDGTQDDGQTPTEERKNREKEGGGEVRPTPEKQTRRTRSDKGTITLKERDEWLLNWIGEQYAVRLDQLQLLIGRDPQGETLVEGQVSKDTARRIVTKRWVQAGWAEQERIYHREPPWVWLTRSGLNAVGLTYPAKRPSPVMLKHYYEVNRVRINLEARHPDAVWVSERRIKIERQRLRDAHYADAEVHTRGARVGVEIELTPKKPANVAGIVAGLVRDYDWVWYFCRPEVVRGVRRAVSHLSTADQRRVKLYDIGTLTEIAHEPGDAVSA